MKHRSTLLMTALMAALLLAIGTSTAAANRNLETSPAGGATASLVFQPLVFSGGGIELSCHVTLSGSIHPRVAKVRGTLAGFLTRVRVAREICRNNLGLNPTSGEGEALIAATGPWHIRFHSFRGTLPRITGVLVQLFGAAFLVRIEVLNCLYRETGAEPIGADGTGRGGAAELTVELLTIQVPNRTLLFEARNEELFRRCPAQGQLSGAGRVQPAIRIRLV